MAKRELMTLTIDPEIARALDPWFDHPNPNVSDDDDDTPDPDVESAKLYRIAIALMAPFSGRDLHACAVVLSQLLGRAEKQMKAHAND